MKIELTGRTALVTASTAGIGLAIAQGLAVAGARVILNGRSTDSVERARQRLLDAVPGADVLGVAADLSDAAGVDTLLAGLPKVDILVNNAGIFGPEDFFETNDATWERYWQTNVMSGVRLSRALLPAMVDAGWGRVLFISSESARNIPADMIHYGSARPRSCRCRAAWPSAWPAVGSQSTRCCPDPPCPMVSRRCSKMNASAVASHWSRSAASS